ncbi:hypothetical protein GECvBMG_gp191c [Salmonella phage GEC_vB_MG]|nr:hypothetical protein GECvBMG_gp191c [Salmonella phage GEC_vB_MG]
MQTSPRNGGSIRFRVCQVLASLHFRKRNCTGERSQQVDDHQNCVDRVLMHSQHVGVPSNTGQVQDDQQNQKCTHKFSPCVKLYFTIKSRVFLLEILHSGLFCLPLSFELLVLEAPLPCIAILPHFPLDEIKNCIAAHLFLLVLLVFLFRMEPLVD